MLKTLQFNFLATVGGLAVCDCRMNSIKMDHCRPYVDPMYGMFKDEIKNPRRSNPPTALIIVYIQNNNFNDQFVITPVDVNTSLKKKISDLNLWYLHVFPVYVTSLWVMTALNQCCTWANIRLHLGVCQHPCHVYTSHRSDFSAETQPLELCYLVIMRRKLNIVLQ